jgi:hypothetical protein
MRTITGSSESRKQTGVRTVPARRRGSVRTWNRRLHYYLGLYFLLFLWLFSLSGLVLNHSSWSVAKFWAARQESTAARPVQRPAATGDLAMAHDLMGQLGIAGEVASTRLDPAAEHFEFQVIKPGHTWQVTAELAAGTASVKEIRVNAFGVLDALHKLTGVRLDEPERQRDWIWTRVWSAAMDALAIGWIVLVLTGIYLWWRIPAKRLGGVIALALGLASCTCFVLGPGLLL